ncbi:MAG: hypothetical protein H0X17_02335 [Deltaproteobacteria bacterium]|nr:hypothetical protein [Deltaproteobacteria bacterium]
MRTLLVLIASVGLVGCVGDVETGSNVDPADPTDDGNDNDDNPAGGNLNAARQLFDTTVYTVINQKCTGGACHSEAATGTTLTRFVAADATKGWEVAVGYQALVGNFAASAAPILTMIKPGHKDVVYAPDEEQKIVAWLDAEVAARNGQPVGPAPTGGETLSQATERVLSAFAGCMTYENFQAANMSQAWGGMEAQNNQNCDNCHTTGAEGFLASRQPQFMYDVVSTKKYYFLQYFTVNLTMGAATAKVELNKSSFLGVANGQDPHREHPRFNALENAGMTASRKFYDATMLRVNTAGVCAPRKLDNQ